MLLRYRLPLSGMRLTFFFIQAFFFVLCSILIAIIPANLPYIVSADASSWITPAESLLLHKDYVMYDNPEYEYLFRPPIIPVFNAFFLWLGGEHGIKTIILAQIVLVSATSFLIAKTADKIQKGAGLVAMVCFLLTQIHCQQLF